MDSDLDLVVLTDRRQRYLEDRDWIAQACGQQADRSYSGLGCTHRAESPNRVRS